ncbi:MAG: hypothetical protein LCH84_16755 [Gemmatimonadetes bacterium]|nr:hypothetical protein [Gemmatimonadota bacterium]
MHSTPFSRLAAAVCGALAVGLALHAAPAVAQSSSQELVSTFCGSGMVNECGTEPTNKTCEFEISVTKDPASTIGISISFTKCTYHGERKVYKDYYRGGAAGACIKYPRTPADATATGGRDEDQELEYLDGEC